MSWCSLHGGDHFSPSAFLALHWCTGFIETCARALIPLEFGSPEAFTFDQTGQFVTTDCISRPLRVIDGSGDEPWTFYYGPVGPGGLAFVPGGSLLGPIWITVLSRLGPTVAISTRYNMTTSEQMTYEIDLSQDNGIVRIPSNGTLFASDNVANSLNKVHPKRTTVTGWHRCSGADGTAASKSNTDIYWMLALDGTQVLSWDIESRANIATSYWKAREDLAWMVIDDLNIDSERRLSAAI